MSNTNTPAVARQLADLLPMAKARAKRTTGELHRKHCQVFWSIYFQLKRQAAP